MAAIALCIEQLNSEPVSMEHVEEKRGRGGLFYFEPVPLWTHSVCSLLRSTMQGRFDLFLMMVFFPDSRCRPPPPSLPPPPFPRLFIALFHASIAVVPLPPRPSTSSALLSFLYPLLPHPKSTSICDIFSFFLSIYLPLIIDIMYNFLLVAFFVIVLFVCGFFLSKANWILKYIIMLCNVIQYTLAGAVAKTGKIKTFNCALTWPPWLTHLITISV